MTLDTPYADVRRAEEADRRAVLDVLTEAFLNDPLVRWLGPPESVQEHYYRHLLTRPMAEAYLAGGRAGAAIWLTLPAGHTPEEEPGGGERLRALGEALAPRHPNRERHLYLPCMGVVTGRQGAGLGSAMLRHRLERADADALPAYLEASSARSRALYRRHGFEDLGEPVHVAGSPPLWPMWRPSNPSQGRERP
ncbi:GNAT family N-acetyltransferase [Nonomuraea sp. NPDC059023]|uniref:GNAT family N-acetyltransferase n=1 Tax=unclassified Nonomuraea TaxID=2593643 RepID=UPI0036BA4FB1